MENFLTMAPVLCFSTAYNGLIEDVNESLCRHLGFVKDELVGQKVDVIFTLPTRIFHQTHFFPLLKMQGHAEEIYITLQTKSKEELPLLLNAEMKMVKAKTVAVYAGIIVHHRKRYEDELIAAKKAAEAALNENTVLLQAKEQLRKHSELLDEKIHTIDKQNRELIEFNRVVTHDLQEPLRKLLFFTNMLTENKHQQGNADVASRISNVSEQMRAILSGLQQYVWLTEATISPAVIDLSRLLLQVKSQHEKENPGIAISFTMENLPVINADREQMHFLFHEVIANAIRFRKHQAVVHIMVETDTLLLNKFRSLTGKYKYDNYLRILVKDDGSGFDAAYKEQALALFKRLHPASGRGIGLSLCKKIVENHQGTISIDSKPDQGTTVVILLPLPGAEAQPKEPDEKKTQKLSDAS